MTATISCRILVSEAEGETQGKAHNKESEPTNTDDQMSQSTSELLADANLRGSQKRLPTKTKRTATPPIVVLLQYYVVQYSLKPKCIVHTMFLNSSFCNVKL